MSGDFYKEWRTYAEVDYFSQFILLWLSTNAWYRSHYAEISTRRDRDFLDKLRGDHSPRNKLYARFERAISSPAIKEHAELFVAIESLSFALNRTALYWDDESHGEQITLQNCMMATNPKSYGPLTVHKNSPGITVSENIKLTDDKGRIFNALLEIVYKVRCMLVHGELEPSKENHDVVRHCYGLLHLMMRF
ncbi:hypothetical protein [Rubrivivax albus]|uniref:Apea-like HEPN domain-containing protein n=1 Tax=Rubrivivax albus TaxID=2499835 RepID=A0A3S3SER2_9BURK|nr:hypothetical protein [Rubrivivax albus]RVT53822.1 hypothetical protein ENE75_02740 [Rubrivivax albus]